MIVELSTNQKLDGTNHSMWYRKIRYLLNKKDLLEHLTVAKFSPSHKDNNGKSIDTTTMQYQESMPAYQSWSKKA